MSQLDILARQHAEIVRDSLSDTTAPRLARAMAPGYGRKSWNRPIARLGVAVLAVALLFVVPFILRSSSPAVDLPPPADGLRPGNGLILTMGLSGQLTAVDQDGNSRSAEIVLPATGETAEFAWSPNGRELAVSEKRQVSVFDTADGKETVWGQLCPTGIACPLAWSSDGNQIAVLDAGVLRVADAKNNTAVKIVDLPEMGVRAVDVVWSSSGDWLILSYRADESNYRLIGLHPDGSEVTEFYQGTSNLPLSYAWSSEIQGVVVLIASVVEPDPGSEFANLQLSVFVSDPGSEPQHIVDVGRCACLGLKPGLATSPDGTLIAMNVPGRGANASSDLSDWGMYIVGVDGAELHRISGAGQGDLSWQPIPGD